MDKSDLQGTADMRRMLQTAVEYIYIKCVASYNNPI